MKNLLQKNNLPSLILSISTILIVAIMLLVSQVVAKSNNSPAAQADDGGVLSYQGMLYDRAGNPITGTYDITFRIYNSPTELTPLWEEAHSVVNAVPLQNGLFNVVLGSLIPIPSSISEETELFLGIQAAGDNELSPRTEILNYFLSSSDARSNLPIGSVIAWWRPDTTTPLPSGEWMVADGSLVTDDSSPMFGTNLPDLRNKFIMGVGEASLGQLGGSNILDLNHRHQADSHTHTITNHAHSSGELYANVAAEDDRIYVQKYGPGFPATNANYTSTSHSNTHITEASADVDGTTGFWSGASGTSAPYTNYSLSSTTDNRPAYVGLVYLVRIK